MSNEATENCFGGFEIGKPSPWQVTAANGDVFEEHDMQEAATAVAEAWNAQTDPLERTHKAAYPFRVEHRTQRAIDAQLKRLGLSDPSLGRSSMVCKLADNRIEVTLSDNAADWCQDADAEEALAILEGINAEQSLEEIREELASKLDCM